jgi:hypothetical protein
MLIPFLPPPGLISDDTSFKAEGRWADGNNVRFVDGSPQAIGQFAALWPTLGNFVKIYGMFAWDRSGTTHIAYGTYDNSTSKVYIGSGAASPTDRTPASMGSGYYAYAFSSWGTDLLFAPTGKTLYQWQGAGSATEITQAPDKISWMLVTSRRQVIAFGCNEVGGTFNDRCIRGSDLEDNTSWTPSSSNNSFEDILDVGGGKIVTAREIGDYVVVLTDSSLFLGTFLGDPAQTYRWEKVASNCGVVGPNAAAVVGQRLYWLGHDLRLRVWVPGMEVATLPCSIFREFQTDCGVVGRGRVVIWHVPKFNEIWISYETTAGAFASVAVSLDSGAWFKSDMAITFGYSSDNLEGALGATFDTNILLAAFAPGTFNAGLVYAAECGGHGVTADGPTSWFIQSADQYLDNSGRRMMIRGVWPDLSTLALDITSSVSLTVYMRDRPMSAPVAKGPYALTAGSSKMDFRASGMIAAIRIGQSPGVDREIRLGKFVFDAVLAGER